METLTRKINKERKKERSRVCQKWDWRKTKDVRINRTILSSYSRPLSIQISKKHIEQRGSQIKSTDSITSVCKHTHTHTHTYIYVCVCVREREREIALRIFSFPSHRFFISNSVFNNSTVILSSTINSRLLGIYIYKYIYIYIVTVLVVTNSLCAI